MPAITKNELAQLRSTLDDLNRNVKSLNSLRRSFAKGLVMGLGSAIGASLIAGIVLLLLGRFLSSLGISNLVPNDRLESYTSTIQEN